MSSLFYRDNIGFYGDEDKKQVSTGLNERLLMKSDLL